MIRFKHTGNFQKTERFFTKAPKIDVMRELELLAWKGVEALRASTPTESGETANAWSYEIKRTNGSFSIFWKNANVVDGVNIAVILQYGHGTGTGGYVQGRDYINPAIRPIFDQIAEKAWKEVTSA